MCTVSHDLDHIYRDAELTGHSIIETTASVSRVNVSMIFIK